MSVPHSFVLCRNCKTQLKIVGSQCNCNNNYTCDFCVLSLCSTCTNREVNLEEKIPEQEQFACAEFFLPKWWPGFWLNYRSIFPQLNQKEAIAVFLKKLDSSESGAFLQTYKIIARYYNTTILYREAEKIQKKKNKCILNIMYFTEKSK